MSTPHLRLSRSPLAVVGVALLVASLGVFAASVFGVADFAGQNLPMASGGAMALGLILLAAGLFARLQESQQERALEAEMQRAETRLAEARVRAERLERAFEDVGIRTGGEER